MRRKKNSVPPHGRNARRRNRQRKARYLIVCGGEKTEPEYFKYLGEEINNVVFKIEHKTQSPLGLVQHAIKLKNANVQDSSSDDSNAYTGIWVVVDVDDYNDHAKAQQQCNNEGIEFIISNPCFEVWLIDHIRQCPDSLTDTKSVERYAANLGIMTGPRNKYIDFSTINEHLENAINNAKRHSIQSSTRKQRRQQLVAGQEHSYAPWTDMYKVETLLEIK